MGIRELLIGLVGVAVPFVTGYFVIRWLGYSTLVAVNSPC